MAAAVETSVDTIQETHLDNGLMILTKEVHAAPVASLWLWYRVGSRNERTGVTGVSHWVEHMMFKGTPRFGKGEIMRLVNRNGGAINAMTWRDFTAYYETLPSDRFDLALEIEADRMVNSLFDALEVQSERTVIISEREGAENTPQFHLYEEMLATAYKVHTYGHDTIGWKCDLETLSRDDLYNHYRAYYTPNNAVLVLVGDFDTSRMLDKVHRLFGAIPAGPAAPKVTAVEPQQEGERRLVVRRPAGAAYVNIAYHAPAASHPDFWPMFVLSGVLSGVGSLNYTSPGASGKSARLYRALVETRLAVETSVSFGASIDPDLFSITATAWRGVPPRRIEAVILRELDRLTKEPPTAEEMAIVGKQVKTQVVYASDGVANLGFSLGAFEIASSYKDYLAILDHVGRVTPDDVQRVAATYFSELNRTIGWFIPTGGEGEAHG
jgi:zinc protease